MHRRLAAHRRCKSQVQPICCGQRITLRRLHGRITGSPHRRREGVAKKAQHRVHATDAPHHPTPATPPLSTALVPLYVLTHATTHPRAQQCATLQETSSRPTWQVTSTSAHTPKFKPTDSTLGRTLLFRDGGVQGGGDGWVGPRPPTLPPPSGAAFLEAPKAPKKIFGLKLIGAEGAREIFAGRRPGRKFGPIF